jgi:hypothetical protein
VLALKTHFSSTELIEYSLCICGILRLAALPRLYFNTYDTTWDALPALLWLGVEAHMAVICASAPALKVFFKDAPAPSRYSPWPSDYSLSRTGSSSSKKFLLEKKSVPVVTDEKLLGSYFNTTGGDQGGRVWFQGIEARDMKALESGRDIKRLDKSLPRPPGYDDINDVYQGRGRGLGYEVRIQGPGRAF